MRLFRVFCLTLLLTVPPIAAPHAEGAKEAVRVRVGAHEGYSRVVFDWGKKVKYTVSQDASGALVLTFARDARIDLSPLTSGKVRNVSGAKATTTDSGTRVVIDAGKGSRYRHLQAGNRVVLDLYDTPPGADKAAAKLEPAAPKDEKPEPKAEPKPEQKVEPKAEPKAEQNPAPRPIPVKPRGLIAATTEPMEETATPAPSSQPAATSAATSVVAPIAATPAPPQSELRSAAEAAAHPEKPMLEPAPAEPAKTAAAVPSIDISLVFTESAGVAVFARAGTLWIVTDKDDIAALPQASGPGAQALGPFSRAAFEGGVAFRAKLPEGLVPSVEGGGLRWTIKLAPPRPNAPESHPKRETAPAEGATEEAAAPHKEQGHESAHAEPKPEAKGGPLSLFWDMPKVRRILSVPDPATGEQLKVATVSRTAIMPGTPHNFVDLDALQSPAGLAILPHADDLDIRAEEGKGVRATRPGRGLSILPETTVAEFFIRHDAKEEQQPADQKRTILKFDRWSLGGADAREHNQAVLLEGMPRRSSSERVEDILTLGKLNAATGHAAEALGFLNLAADLMPDLDGNPEFLALRGAAQAMNAQYDLAFRSLTAPQLAPFQQGDAGFWMAYTLAGLNDWAQAGQRLPTDLSAVTKYPAEVRDPLALTLAEVALRDADVPLAEKLLGLAQQDKDTLHPNLKAQMDYLQGEAARQRGDKAKAKALWTPLTSGRDDYYRAKSVLALTALELEDGTMLPKDAIGKLEGLRYLWRGDDLEITVNRRLGELYLAQGEYLKGLGLLKLAASLSPESESGKKVAADMAQTFRDLFIGERAKDVPPLASVELYDAFPDLTPAGPEGDQLISRLVDRLVEVDLIDRAVKLLRHLIDHRLQGLDAGRASVRLAALQLLNNTPQDALKSLDAATAKIQAIPNAMTPRQAKEITLLRARALSRLNRPNDALSLLAEQKKDQDVLAAQADTAWKAGRWSDAAEALEERVALENLSEDKPLDEAQAGLIMNWAVALNLSGNRPALETLRDRYRLRMARLPQAKAFDVVTRPRQTTMLADRETLNSIVSEVDMFRGFLDSVKLDAATKPPQPKTEKAAPMPEPTPEPAPAATPEPTP